MRATGLRYVCDTEPGIRRRRCGSGFVYLDCDGRRISDRERLREIRAVAIPPAWTDVWICADACGHLQATGRDARGRKQYRYHPDWRAGCEQHKFDRLSAFGRALPTLRRRVRRDLAQPGLPRDKVLALVVSVLSTTLVRIGNREYRRNNHSYGLTTLRDRHVRFLDGRAWLRFRGKAGQMVAASVDDPRLVPLIRRCQELPGQTLFQFVDDSSGSEAAVQPIDSGMVNEYLRACMGEAFTAKDFRTWGGSLCAAVAFAATPLPEPPQERALAACQAAVVREVAGLLGNTPAVCRRSYIHPEVFAAWEDGRLHRLASGRRFDTLRACERFTLRVLAGQQPR